MQTEQPLLVLWFPGEVEAGGKDAQLYVRVVLQVLHHLPCTLEAGAPGHEPFDMVFLSTGHILDQEYFLGFEPVQEAEFCVVRLLRIELGDGEGKGALWAGRTGMWQGRQGGTRAPGARVSGACYGLLYPFVNSTFPCSDLDIPSTLIH